MKNLNQLLASYQVFYNNLRGYHWNIKGSDFFELHEKYEELYNEVNDIIDVLAEKISSLGEIPLHSLSAYLKESVINEDLNVVKGDIGIKNCISSLETLIQLQKDIYNKESKDIGTQFILQQSILSLEKTLWKYKTYFHK